MTLPFLDLDGTIIFSRRSSQNELTHLVPVERYRDRHIAFMTPKAYELMNKLMAIRGFVPTTTRTLEQFNRVSFSHRTEWAIVCNGAVILHNGIEDVRWSQHISQVIPKDRNLVFDQLIHLANDHGWVNQVVRDTFFYMVTPHGMNEKQQLKVHHLIRTLDSERWVTSIQARKIYVLPRAVDKALAMQAVLDYTGYQESFAAGDSRLDLNMMLEADSALRPAHGELVLEPDIGQEQVRVTRSSGALAGEEILLETLRLTEQE